jgi:hypothetical protein
MHIETNEKEPAYERLTMKQTTERTPIHTQMTIVITVFTVIRGCDLFNLFNPDILLCKAKARTWISNVICCGVFVFSEFNLAIGVPFVDSDVIVDHHLSSHIGVDALTNPRQSILLHNVLSNRE